MGGLLGLSRGIDRINTWIGRSVSWLILLSILVSAGNALVRFFQNTALFREYGITASNMWLEAQWYLYSAAFLLAAAYTLLENEHIRIDVLYARWSRRVQHWIDLIGSTLFLLPFTALVLYLTYPWVMRSIRLKEMSMNAGGLMLWPAKILLLIGFGMLFLQGISEIIKKIAVMRGIIPDHHEGNSHEAMAAEAAGMTLPDSTGTDEQGTRK